jgi:hypothetical protein
VGAADAPVLREADSGPWWKLSCFNLADRRFHDLPKFLSLVCSDGRQEILNLWEAFPHERHDGNVGDASDPGIANELQIEGSQSFRLIGITTTGGFPFEQALCAIQLTDGIDVGHKFVSVWESPDKLLLHVLLGLANADSVISGKLLQEADPLAK